MGLSAIGPVMQIAFVPDDFDAAIAHWTAVMGAGPFFLIDNIKLPESLYLGQPNECIFSIAIGYWRDMQVELIRQENDAPSIYTGAEGKGLHHICILTDDIASARATAEAAGAKILVEGRVDPDGGVLYVDTGGGPGSIVEILQPATGTLGLFEMIKAASQDWNGSEPVRRLG
jgi:catechol 2,3-dioxygenase-like lactoylglutathione lyase family enzyme